MDGFLKIVGAATFAMALLAVVLLAASSRGAGIASLLYALPAMVAGAATYALGAILNNLIAIRAATERQADALSFLANQARNSTP
ncbi:hypothetical protein HFO05_07230 [Rhizobium laguerreae]|uniref:hypothetical protein n=1 Tax=Rhizobium laguerreae TaxID=1076926 RepID=UPI001C929F67|nr:hypothetical protein [Rhizobium laguerreae]MBY3268404.1 hypothetical protein [Rhizobium laguerreae]